MGLCIEGGCLCGAIRYRATAPPISRSICHCRSCRRAGGAPSVAWSTFHVNSLVFCQGVPMRYPSSEDVVRTFCGNCGTPLSYRHVLDTDTIDITTATLDAPEQFPPTRETWIEHKLPWERLNESTRHYPRGGDGN
ncbi:GFA family protein [Lysobacter panacisoli]|uniref:GFA family protein n=1 Tax=Lysobacter panacisoli TaxID=1255263 RepID=A0ABP9L5B0_9GAMM|nr:GFA family protein [Lysobacter panacisoli]